MANFENKASIAFADTYFQALKKLPYNALKDTNNLIEKFMKDPTARSLNYEKLITLDSSIRSIRVNGSYRAIVKIPSSDAKNVYTLLWVDSHDDAYDWAKRKKIVVNQVSNAVEIYDSIEETEVIDAIDKDIEGNKNITALFNNFNDSSLRALGIREDFLFIIRAIINLNDLEKAKPFLPSQAYELLSYLAYGFDYSEVRDMIPQTFNDLSTSKIKFEDAIASDINKDHFYVANEPDEKEAIMKYMNLSLNEWRLFLHPSQKRIIDRDYDGAVNITGSAGTGKTVIAIHRAKKLAENLLGGTSRVLLTTFSTSLVDDIKQLTKEICSTEVFNRIEIINFDKWIYQYLIKYIPKLKIIYGADVMKLWKEALTRTSYNLNYPLEFYQKEYEQIILEQEITSFDTYKYANRTGSGTTLDRIARQKIWKIIEEYNSILDENNVADMGTLMNSIILHIKHHHPKGLYPSIIIDEAQDFNTVSFKLLKAIAGPSRTNDIMIVGDMNQNIYNKKLEFDKCGIDIEDRIEKLYLNYRNTNEICQFAKQILNNSIQDCNTISLNSIATSIGREPKFISSKKNSEELIIIEESIKKWIALGYDKKSICVTARTNKVLDLVKKYLSKAEFEIYEIKNDRSENQDIDGIRFATMHRIKGLEFDCVMLVGANKDVIPNKTTLDEAVDGIHKKSLKESERALLYVALTRARKELIITSSGEVSEFFN